MCSGLRSEIGTTNVESQDDAAAPVCLGVLMCAKLRGPTHLLEW